VGVPLYSVEEWRERNGERERKREEGRERY
jgi:hypothetical protein